jgi:hypothetical protein
MTCHQCHWRCLESHAMNWKEKKWFRKTTVSTNLVLIQYGLLQRMNSTTSTPWKWSFQSSLGFSKCHWESSWKVLTPFILKAKSTSSSNSFLKLSCSLLSSASWIYWLSLNGLLTTQLFKEQHLHQSFHSWFKCAWTLETLNQAMKQSWLRTSHTSWRSYLLQCLSVSHWCCL